MPKSREQLKELTMKKPAELEALLAASREELRDLRFRVASDQHKDIREVRDIRTRIARILTIKKQRAGTHAESVTKSNV